MRRIVSSIWLAIVLVLLVSIPVLAYSYIADITVTESNGDAYTDIGLSLSIDNEDLADNGYIEPDSLDTRILYSSSEVAHMVAEDRTNFYASSILADSVNHYYYTFGNDDLTSTAIIPGYDGYVTIGDAAALEAANDFEIEIDGYVDTADSLGGNYLVYKEGAFLTWVSDVDEISAAILGAVGVQEDTTAGFDADHDVYGVKWYGQTLTPSSDFIVTQVWINYNTTQGNPDGTTVSIRATSGGLPTGDDLTTGVGAEGVETIDVGPCLLENGVQYALIARCLDGDAANYEQWWFDQTAPPYAGGTVVSSNDSGSSWASDAAKDFDCYLTGSVVSKQVTATGISPDEINTKVTADTTDLKIYIDSSEEDSIALGGASVPDNNNDWLLMTNATPYLNYYKHTVSSTLITHYQPIDMISGTTLPDREGAGQDGDITWGSNPTGIDLEIGSAVPEGQLIPSAGIEEEVPEDIVPEGGSTDPSDYSTPDAGTVARAVYDFIDPWADLAEIPTMVVVNIGAIALVVLAIVIPAILTGGKHLLLVFMSGLVFMGVFVGIKFLPAWPLYIYTPLGITLLVMERKFAW